MLSDAPAHPKVCTTGAQGTATACAGRVAIAEGCRDTVQSVSIDTHIYEMFHVLIAQRLEEHQFFSLCNPDWLSFAGVTALLMKHPEGASQVPELEGRRRVASVPIL